MDFSEVSWLSEMGLDNPIFTEQFDFMDTPFEEELAAVLGQDDFEMNCLSRTATTGGGNSSSSSILVNNPSTNSIISLATLPATTELPTESPPTKLHKPNNYSNFSTANPDKASSTPIILNFVNANSDPESNFRQQGVNYPRALLNPDEEAAVSEVLRSQLVGASNGDVQEDQAARRAGGQNTKRTSRVRPPSQTYDHIIAERKRREQLSQRFVALSTIVPGLKKTDKTSVLGDAIKYLKFLQERVKILEEQATKKTMESAVLVRRSQLTAANDDEDDWSSSGGGHHEQPLPEIEARICHSQILIKVHCENQRGILAYLISKVEELNLAIVNTNVASFGSLALDVTIITEMEKEFSLTVNDVVKRLRAAIPDAL